MRKTISLLVLLSASALAAVVPNASPVDLTLASVPTLGLPATRGRIIARDSATHQPSRLVLTDQTEVWQTPVGLRSVRVTLPGDAPTTLTFGRTLTLPVNTGNRLCFEPLDIPGLKFSITIHEGTTTLDLFATNVNVSHPSRDFDLQLGCP